MTIDEIFAAMPAAAAEEGREYLVIDPVTRSITVPEAERIFGVESDADAARKYFICPRYVGDNLDLASMFLTVNYRNANGEEDGYPVDDVAVNGEYVTFSWQLWPKVVAYKGTVQFTVCATLPNSANRRGPDWNTTIAKGDVLEGLDPDRGDVEGETSDVVTALRAMVSAQTAAVEATGAAQVEVVEAAGAAATSDAQAQIEAKGAATLATIPADYTTLANKSNEHANAIKGRLAGEIVRADDVSPVEHYLGVKVRGKNLLPYPYNVTTHTVNGVTFTDNGDGSFTLNGTSTANFAIVFQTDLNLALSGPCTFSMGTAKFNGAGGLYLKNANGKTVMFLATTKTTATETINETVTRFDMWINSGHTFDNFTVYPQLEIGAEATEYTPYIDPATVTVTRCGKNLIDYKKPVLSYSIESTEINNGLHLAGRYMASFPVNIPAGTAVAMSWNTANAEGSVVDVWRIQYADTTYSPYCNNGAAMVAQLPVAQVCLYVNKGDADGAADFTNIKLELGEAVTAYEPYNGVTAMPDAAGIVTGLPSLAPTMTMLADTPGVTIECEYNRDSNAVYAELLAKIAALSGTT